MVSKSNRQPVEIRSIPEDDEYVAGWTLLSWNRGCYGASWEWPEDRLVELRDALNHYLGET